MNRNEPDPLLPLLDTGETVLWQGGPAKPRVHASTLVPPLLFGVVFALLATWLAADSGFDGPVPPLVFVAALTVSTVPALIRIRRSGRQVYAITDRRLVVVDGAAHRSFGPGEIVRLDVEPNPDGTVDLFWGEEEQPRRSRPHRTGLTLRLRPKSRTDRIGFLGLASAEPVASQLRAWLGGHHDRVAAAVAGPRGSVDAVAAGAGSAAAAADGWHTLREPDSGFAIDLPSNWTHRMGHFKSHRLLGVRIERMPVWFDSPRAGWNRLEADPGLPSAMLKIDLNSDGMPADLDAVLNSRASRLLNVSVEESHADLRIGGLSGFAVVQGLKGVGPAVSVGPVRVGMGSIQADLIATQIWLRSEGLAVHVHFVVPRDARSLRDVIARAVATMRIAR